MAVPLSTQKPDFPWWLAVAVVIAVVIAIVIAANDLYSQVFGIVAKGLGITIFVTIIGYALASMLGLAVALRWKLPVAAASALIGMFAIFHGHAHGGEMPVDASGLTYAIGFMLATALLHVAGIGLGLAIGKIGARSKLVLQASGGAMALAGVALLGGYL